MATSHVTTAGTEQPEVHRLKSGSLGLLGILLLAFSSAAPLVGCLGNIPLAVAFGNGVGAPAGFIVAMVVLLCFAVGYVAMTRRLSATGGFYSFISNGLSKPLGLASGLSLMLGYLCVQVAVLGAIGYFGAAALEEAFGISLSWLVIAGIALVLAAVASYFGVELSAKVLGVFFVLEIIILAIVNGAIFIDGGPEGISLEPVNPVNAFSGIAPGIGIFFAFWSWLGFEVVPNYAEESKNPKKLVPLATYLAVIGIGLILFVTAWATVTGFGTSQVVEETTALHGLSYISLAQSYVGAWAADCINWLVITGCFASILAFHQTVSRYIYAIAREGVLFPNKLAHTHPRFGSPHNAAVATFFGAALILGLFTAFYFAAPSAQEFAGNDFNTAAYYEVFGWFAIACTFWVMLNQILCSIATIRYHRLPAHREHAHWWRTLLAPGIGAIGLAGALYLLWSNLSTLGGDIIWVSLIPWFCISWFVFSLLIAFWLRSNRPAAYEGLGRVLSTTAEDAQEEVPTLNR
jgi:amino acid transporter